MKRTIRQRFLTLAHLLLICAIVKLSSRTGIFRVADFLTLGCTIAICIASIVHCNELVRKTIGIREAKAAAVLHAASIISVLYVAAITTAGDAAVAADWGGVHGGGSCGVSEKRHHECSSRCRSCNL